ncbi:MAG: glycosyl transferase [Colwelliaceae bacterium]|nr:glycosyl transferase [Colwelliaceae bacterium]
MKVTVVTAVLNGVSTIAECIASVQAQSYANIEHLVVDGGSTDGTIELLESMGVSFISSRDAGIYNAFNKGIRLATGDVIHILNADDKYKNNKVVEDVMSKLSETAADICHGRIEQTSDTGEVLRLVGRDINLTQLRKKMWVAHPSVFVRREVYSTYGLFSEGFKVAADHEFLLRVWSKVNITFLPEVLVTMRLGGASNSQVELSYRESMAASVIHGAHPLKAVTRYYFERAKSLLLRWRSNEN